MIVKGILFDINGTLLDIHTDEGHDEIYRVLSKVLSYQGIALGPDSLKEQYFQVMKEQRAASREHHPEFDAVGIFREIILQHSTTGVLGFPACSSTIQSTAMCGLDCERSSMC